jgi:hypothetical protein
MTAFLILEKFKSGKIDCVRTLAEMTADDEVPLVWSA